MRFLNVFAAAMCSAVVAHATDVNKANCSMLNYGNPLVAYTQTNGLEHTSGYHKWVNNQIPYCTYTPLAQATTKQACVAFAQVTSKSNGGVESGAWTFGTYHTPNTNDFSGGAYGAAGAVVTAGGKGYMAVHSCSTAPCDAAPITFSGSANGLNVSVSIPSGERIVWQDGTSVDNTCSAYTLLATAGNSSTTCLTPTYPAPTDYMQGFWPVWDTATCSWDIVPSGQSPIFVDTKGNNWKDAFTDPTKGEYVTFQIDPKKPPMKISWPKHGRGIAMLVVDNGDGIIKNGSQAFGNFTAHANGDYTGYVNETDANGITALAYYDQPAQGGNGDTIISARDAIWRGDNGKKLRLWIDEHCWKHPDTVCQSDPSELHDLAEFDYHSFSLVGAVAVAPEGVTPVVCPSWQRSIGWCDAAHNEYRYQLIINPLSETKLHVDGKNQGRVSNDIDAHGVNRKRYGYDVWVNAVP